MIRNKIHSRAAAAFAAAFAAAAPAGALQISHGDLVGVFVKNGTEVIVNMGPVNPGGTLDLSGELGPLGNLAGAKFVGLAVENPDAMVNVPGAGTQPQQNVIYTSQIPDPMPSDLDIENAMNILENSSPMSNVWFNQLRNLPGTDSETVSTSSINSYTLVLGLGTDAIANNFTFSTAGTFDQDAKLHVGLFSAARGYEPFGGAPTEYTALGTLSMDGPDVMFEVPEAAGLLQLLAGAAVLLGAVRLRSAEKG